MVSPALTPDVPSSSFNVPALINSMPGLETTIISVVAVKASHLDGVWLMGYGPPWAHATPPLLFQVTMIGISAFWSAFVSMHRKSTSPRLRLARVKPLLGTSTSAQLLASSNNNSFMCVSGPSGMEDTKHIEPVTLGSIPFCEIQTIGL